MSVELKPHNDQAYSNAKELLNNSKRAAVIHPTGTGKSFIALKLIEDNFGKKVIYLSPSVPILNQLKTNMVKSNVTPSNVKRYTYQKLTALNKSKDKLNIGADIIILDEFHHCGAPEWGKAVEKLIAENPNAQVLGLSATPMRYFGDEIRDMAEELFGDNIASEISLEEAIASGILREPEYTTGIYEYDEIISDLEEKIQKSSNDDNKEIAQQELEVLRKLLDGAVNGLPELLEQSMKNKNGRYIIYCKNIEDMQKKMAEAKEMFGRVNENMSIMSVSSREEDIRKNATTLRKFEKDDNDDKLKLLFSVDMLNEGYHLNSLDGVIMMRPTFSPTLYYQQIGRALSVGNEQSPVIIDLVNNIDSIEIVEGFSRRLDEIDDQKRKNGEVTQTRRKFKISEDIRNVREIVDRIDKLVKRQNLSNEEKLALMEEYINKTGNSITSNVKYKGYNLGNMKNNLRQNYFNGLLNIDEKLLEKFRQLGIITDTKEKVRTSQEEKYDFLMSLVNMSKEERIKYQMESGLTYKEVIYSLQLGYNSGKLKLDKTQVQNLLEKGFLRNSPKEKKNLEIKYNLPLKYALVIENEYGGSYEEFIQAFKKGEVELDFKDKRFVGARAVMISSQALTEKQKMGYYRLYSDITGECNFQYSNVSYISIEAIKERLSFLDERQRAIIEGRYGLINGNVQNYEDIANKTGYSIKTIENYVSKIVSRLSKSSRYFNFTYDFFKLYEEVLEYNREYKIIKSHVLNIDGTPKEIQDINYVDIAKDIGHARENVCNDITHIRENVNNILSSLGIYDDEPIEELTISANTFSHLKGSEATVSLDSVGIKTDCLKRAGINTVEDFRRKSDEELKEIRNLGKRGQTRIIELKQKFKPINVANEVKHLETILKEKVVEYISTKERCEQALHNYLYIEDILDPEGIVPGVESREVTEEEIMQVLNDLNSPDRIETEHVKQKTKSAKKIAQVIRNVSVNDADKAEEFLASITKDKQIEGVDHSD